MLTQVATVSTQDNEHTPRLFYPLSQELKSFKSGGASRGSGAVFGAGDGGSATPMNNVDRPHHELNITSIARTSMGNNSDPREKEYGHKSISASNPKVTSSMETGLLANHKLKNVGGGDPPPSSHHHTPPQQQSQPFNQFQQHHQRQIQNNNISNQQSAHGDFGNRQHGGKENILGDQTERHQQLLNKSEEEDQSCKTGDRMGSRYDHGNLGPTNNNINQSQSGNSSVSEFNNYYGNGRGGPCFDQHGGQQSPGTGIMHSAQNSMDQVQNSHEGYHNNPYNHYPNYRPGYGGTGYGMMSPSRQGNNMMGPGGNTTSASHGKAAMATASAPGGGNVGGFQRFPGQNQQHPSGATPTLNQLLTSPSPMMRGYGSGYQDFNNPSAQQQQSSMGLSKEMSSQYAQTSHGWGGQQRNHPAMSPGNNGHGGNRGQVGPITSSCFKCQV